MRGILLAACLVTSPAFAEIWSEIGQSKDGTSKILLSYDSMKVANGHVVIWARVNSRTPDSTGAVQFTSLYDFDCRAQAYKVRATATNDMAGKSIGDQVYVASAQLPHPIVPDTMLAEAFKATCGDPFLMAMDESGAKKRR